MDILEEEEIFSISDARYADPDGDESQRDCFEGGVSSHRVLVGLWVRGLSACVVLVWFCFVRSLVGVCLCFGLWFHSMRRYSSLLDAVVKKVPRPIRREIIRTAFRRALSADPMAAVGPQDLAFVGIRAPRSSATPEGGSSASVGNRPPAATPGGGSSSTVGGDPSSASPDGGSSSPDAAAAAAAKAAVKSKDSTKQPKLKKRKVHEISSDSDVSSGDSSDDGDDVTSSDDDDVDAGKKKRKARKEKLNTSRNVTTLFNIIDDEVMCCLMFVWHCVLPLLRVYHIEWTACIGRY